jgi:NTP pyrophosphatase (non-canonical NTP hydrolase)
MEEQKLKEHINEVSEKVKQINVVDMEMVIPTSDLFPLIRQWARERKLYEKGDSKTQYVKLQEEAGELAKALLNNNRAEIDDAIGDVVVVLTNLAHLEGLTIEDCIRNAYNVISKRKGKMVNGTFIKEKL